MLDHVSYVLVLLFLFFFFSFFANAEISQNRYMCVKLTVFKQEKQTMTTNDKFYRVFFPF